MSTWATKADIAIDYGPISTELGPRVEALIDRAEAQLLDIAPDFAARVSANRPPLVLVKQVISEMVVAVLRNPDGVRTVSQSVGPFSGTRTYDSVAGRLEVTDRQRALLGLPAAQSASAFTIAPGR